MTANSMSALVPGCCQRTTGEALSPGLSGCQQDQGSPLTAALCLPGTTEHKESYSRPGYTVEDSMSVLEDRQQWRIWGAVAGSQDLPGTVTVALSGWWVLEL